MFAGAHMTPFLVLAALVGARDATYGRVDGDLGLVFGLGATFTPRGASGAIDLRARYLDTAGVYVGYDEGFGREIQTPLEQSAYITLTLAWHQILRTHAIDLGDRITE